MEDIDEDSSSLVLGPSSDLHWCKVHGIIWVELHMMSPWWPKYYGT